MSFFSLVKWSTCALTKSVIPSFTNISQTLLMLIRIYRRKCATSASYQSEKRKTCMASHLGILSATEEVFSSKSVALSDVVIAISHFSSQSRRVDGVPQKVIVKALPVNGECLFKIVNSSFAQGVFLSSWKLAQAIPLKKSVTSSTPSDFRPIALLCFPPRCLKRLPTTKSRSIKIKIVCSILSRLDSVNIIALRRH